MHLLELCSLGNIIFFLKSLWFIVIMNLLNIWKAKTNLTRGVPVGWPGSSSCVACPHELWHLRSTPSVNTWKEVNKGAPSQLFALWRSSQLARNIKGDAPPYRNTVKGCSEGGRNTEKLVLCCPNCLVLTVGAQRKQLGFVLCVTYKN